MKFVYKNKTGTEMPVRHLKRFHCSLLHIRLIIISRIDDDGIICLNIVVVEYETYKTSIVSLIRRNAG